MGNLAKSIAEGKTSLGIEFGSTRIKAVLMDEHYVVAASGSYDWENRLENQIWTYSLDDVWTGLQSCYRSLAENVLNEYGFPLERIGAIGISGMMHGYMAFDEKNKLLVPFRTWRNTMTQEASDQLTELFHYHIPQRWSIAHLYQAILNQEPHVGKVRYFTTLAGYVHWKLTGKKVLGVGEASGMFPIDETTGDFQQTMICQFDELIADRGFSWKLEQLLPQVLTAGEPAGTLSMEGALLLDPSGTLQPGIPMCPPESDAGTGMVATNSVARRTGNVSAGTSVFTMAVLEKDLQGVYPEIDMVTTPAGAPVAMVHCNNCTSDLNAWEELFHDFAESCGMVMDKNTIFTLLFKKALEGEADGGGLLPYNYYSGEHITGFEEGRPLLARTPDSHFTLANLMRANLMTSLGALKIGLDILLQKENVRIDILKGHGGFFKTPVVGQRIMAAAVNAPVAVLKTASEGGAFGIAVLAAYMQYREPQETLEAYLENRVFAGQEADILQPDPEDVAGFNRFIERYKAGLAIERAAVDVLKETAGTGAEICDA